MHASVKSENKGGLLTPPCAVATHATLSDENASREGTVERQTADTSADNTSALLIATDASDFAPSSNWDSTPLSTRGAAQLQPVTPQQRPQNTVTGAEKAVLSSRHSASSPLLRGERDDEVVDALSPQRPQLQAQTYRSPSQDSKKVGQGDFGDADDDAEAGDQVSLDAFNNENSGGSDGDDDSQPATQPRRAPPTHEEAKQSLVRELLAEYARRREQQRRAGSHTPPPIAPREAMSMINRDPMEISSGLIMPPCFAESTEGSIAPSPRTDVSAQAARVSISNTAPAPATVTATNTGVVPLSEPLAPHSSPDAASVSIRAGHGNSTTTDAAHATMTVLNCITSGTGNLKRSSSASLANGGGGSGSDDLSKADDKDAPIHAPSVAAPLVVVKAWEPSSTRRKASRRHTVFAGTSGTTTERPLLQLQSTPGTIDTYSNPRASRAASIPAYLPGQGEGSVLRVPLRSEAAATPSDMAKTTTAMAVTAAISSGTLPLPERSQSEGAVPVVRNRKPLVSGKDGNAREASPSLSSARNLGVTGAAATGAAKQMGSSSRSPSPAVNGAGTGDTSAKVIAVAQPVAHRKPVRASADKRVAAASATSDTAHAAPSWSPPPTRSESRPTDEPDVVVPAFKYSFNVAGGRWSTSDVMVRVLHPNRGLSQGGMRVAFEVEELDETGFSSPMVAKMFRHIITNVVEEDYFNEGEAQCLCEVFADSFNKVTVDGAEKVNISFLQCTVVRIPRDGVPESYRTARKGFFSYRTTDTRDVVFCMEPRLSGNFTKYTSNFGDVYETNEVFLPRAADQQRRKVLSAVEAFSHFTLVESGGSMLVCDLQGVNDFLTDPQIHTEDGKGFGMGNLGQEGIDEWVKTHQCKELCRAMHLQSLEDGVAALAEGKRGNYFRLLVNRLQSQEPVRPQDLIPLTKPLSEMDDEERFEYAVRLSELMGS